MAITRIHVNQHAVRANRALPAGAPHEPIITVKRGGENRYAQTVDILGPSRVVYSPERPLPCGARVWIETTADVVLHGEQAPPHCATLPDIAPARRRRLP